MKKIFSVLLVCISVASNAQSINDSLSSVRFTLEDTVADKLADLAVLRNPSLKVYDKNAEADMYEWKKSRLDFLNRVNASFNLNEANLKSSKDDSTGPNLFFPRYNFSVSVPLSIFFTRPHEIKRAKSVHEASIATKESQTITLRGEVKKAYKLYLANKYQITLQETILQDESALFAQAQEKFQNSQTSLDVFTNASRRYNAELAKKLQYVRDLSISRVDLEVLINMDLVEALNMVSPAGKK